MAITNQHYIKTRIAPTPSGFLHLGNVLSFAVTVALAHKHGSKVLLRIDDLDQARVSEQYIQDIFDTLNFLEIPWDEGPRNAKEFADSYSQLHRMDIYHTALKKLSDAGHLFACTCSRKQIAGNAICTCFNKHYPLTAENTAENTSWRLLTANKQELTVNNYNGQTTHQVLPGEMQNFVVRKKDGFPAYQLTSVMDDFFYGIDLVVRGEDLWPSTLGQHRLALALCENAFKNVTFYHHPLLTELSGKKLSKSAGAISIRHLRRDGKTPTDIYTMIANMMGLNQTITNWQQLGEMLITL